MIHMTIWRPTVPFNSEKIEEHFGPKLRSFGFVPYKDGFNWYKLKNGNILLSVFFDEAENESFSILFDALPLCTKLLYPLKNWKDRGLNMQCNYCMPLYYIWRYFNPLLCQSLDLEEIHPTEDEILTDKINRYNLILDKLILPYFDSVNEPKDLVYFEDREVVSVISYLYNDLEGFYKNTFTQRAILFESEITYDCCPEEYGRLRRTIHQAVKERELSLIGKHLQEQEQQNIKYLKRRFPDLFNGDVKVEPFVTEELLQNKVLTEIVEVTKDDLHSSVQRAEYCTPFNRLGAYIPFLRSFPNFVLTEERTKRNASELIASTFSEELKSYGLQPSEDMLSWTTQNDETNKFVNFVCSQISPIISIEYGVSLLCENDVSNDKTVSLVNKYIAEHTFFNKYHFAPPNEPYPCPGDINALNEWQKKRIACLLKEIIFPFLNN